MKQRYFLLIIFSLFLISCGKKQEAGNSFEESGVVLGIDVSQYQGKINWKKVASQDKHKIKFVFCRSTMGAKRKDTRFKFNFSSAKKEGFIVGAYHYYDPNENSLLQARNFLETVSLQPGDLVPVVDIEVHPKIQSRENLAKGILRWLKEVESVYGVKPIIYTGFAFYRDYLSSYPEIRKYPLWVSAFSSDRRGDPIIKSAILHQFSSQLRVPGIPENVVDGNDFDVRNERLVFLR